jgi:hypothetical protein
MSNFLKYTFLVAVYHLLSVNLVISQGIVESKSNKWGIKIGVINYSNKIQVSPISGGRGNGCFVGHTINEGSSTFGLNLGVFHQKYIGKKFSVIFGPEVNLTSTQSDYNTSLVCVGGMLRYESKGTLSYAKTNFFIPILFRYETSFIKSFVEFGAYHDLLIESNALYNYTNYEYYENFQLLPEPKVSTAQKTFNGSNYGLIFGIGKSFLKNEEIETRLQFCASLSKNITLDEYRFIRQSLLNLSISYRL